MLDYQQISDAIEVHFVERITQYFEEGGNPNEVNNGIPLFTTMVEMYTRTPRFKYCVNAFVHAGLDFEDKALLWVLADDAVKLEKMILCDPGIVTVTLSLIKNTYTPLTGGTLLHYCAEYDSVACAKVLLKHGADVNARAGTDQHGFGGHTPIFHTVNQNRNNSAAVLKLLLEHSADLTVSVKGLIWGEGYKWETFIPAVNPISYAMMGRLPQMHRDEGTVAGVVSLLVKHAYGINYTPPNVPNAYLLT